MTPGNDYRREFLTPTVPELRTEVEKAEWRLRQWALWSWLVLAGHMRKAASGD